MATSNGVRQLFAFLLTVVTVSACTVVVEQSPAPVRPQACTFEYAPVCARRGSQQRTFSNACMARASGFRPVYRGQCRASIQPGPPRPAVCTREFAPVCAVRGDRTRSFNNACLARADGFRVIHAGRCR
jgi:hypothetical protein